MSSQPTASPAISPKGPFLISHEFNAPRERLWKAWTEREQLMKWFGPKGVSMSFATVDFRPGGKFHYCLRLPSGGGMWAQFVYREIIPQERFVYVTSFSDESGGVTRAPFPGPWPLEMLCSVTFTERNGKTTVTVQSEALNPTPEERATFDGGHASMRGGWGGTFQQLEQFLSQA